MAQENKIVTGLGKAEKDRVLVRGRDLTKDLLGKITFSEMTFLMLAGRLPADGERRMIDALLTVLVEHGMVNSVVAARVTYHTAPEAMQGAVAAAILGAGSVHLGSSEWSAKMLVDAAPIDDTEDARNAAAASVVERHQKQGRRIAGIGHRTHPEGDPRAARLFEIARETGVYGRYCDLIQRVCRAAEAIAMDMALSWQLTKAFALIGRTLGAIAHIGEEIRNPITPNIDAAIKAALVYEPDNDPL
jgi:citrate synthase